MKVDNTIDYYSRISTEKKILLVVNTSVPVILHTVKHAEKLQF